MTTTADLRRGFRYRLTRPGITYLVACGFVLIASVNSGTNLLYMVFGLMVGSLCLSLIFPVMMLRGIEIDRSLGEHAVAGEPADVEYVIRNTRRSWPVLGLRFREADESQLRRPREGFMLYVPRKSKATLLSALTPRRRGILKLPGLLLSSTFPFGFIVRTLLLQSPEELVVYPRIGLLHRRLALQFRESIESGTMTSNVRGGNDEFYGLREYRPGDNIRTIHWRSTARTRQLMIREMSANAPPQMMVVLNLRAARPGESELVERAIELAASLVAHGFFENYAVGLAIAGLPAGMEKQAAAQAGEGEEEGSTADTGPAVQTAGGHEPEVLLPPQMGRSARDVQLRRLAMLDPGAIRPDLAIPRPNRLVGRAHWMIVTLHRDDPCGDLLNPSSAQDRGGATPGRGGSTRAGHHTILALDTPDAANWLHFLTAQETSRLLRSRSDSGTPSPLPPAAPATAPSPGSP